jgi:hypothetical protein
MIFRNKRGNAEGFWSSSIPTNTILTLYIQLVIIELVKIDYSLHGIRFEWESQKAEINLRKHGIAFETACEVFFDPFLRMMDPENLNGQIREAIVGLTMN